MAIKPENYRLIRRHFYKLFGYKCAICGIECDENGFYDDDNGNLCTMELDHIKPNGVMRYKVGTSQRTWEWFAAYENNNLQMLCVKCNCKKGDN